MAAKVTTIQLVFTGPTKKDIASKIESHKESNFTEQERKDHESSYQRRSNNLQDKLDSQDKKLNFVTNTFFGYIVNSGHDDAENIHDFVKKYSEAIGAEIQLQYPDENFHLEDLVKKIYKKQKKDEIEWLMQDFSDDEYEDSGWVEISDGLYRRTISMEEE